MEKIKAEIENWNSSPMEKMEGDWLTKIESGPVTQMGYWEGNNM